MGFVFFNLFAVCLSVLFVNLLPTLVRMLTAGKMRIDGTYLLLWGTHVIPPPQNLRADLRGGRSRTQITLDNSPGALAVQKVRRQRPFGGVWVAQLALLLWLVEQHHALFAELDLCAGREERVHRHVQQPIWCGQGAGLDTGIAKDVVGVGDIRADELIYRAG